ncbi:bifunctional DNA primase/polymerase [Streptomyces sp. GMY02]|nr:bifunctional DNA primase/polymerase [Streptomyces sp. GMY02]
MSAWPRDAAPLSPGTPLRTSPGASDDERRADLAALLHDGGEGGTHGTDGDGGGASERSTEDRHRTAARITPAGADWLATAAPSPRTTLSRWAARPTAPTVLTCGSAFDVVSVPCVFGRRMLDRLWAEGPGSGPVAAHRGRTLLFAVPGTAQRLPSLLSWQQWDGTGARGRHETAPPLLCHGVGDAVTVPPLEPGAPSGPHWVVAPETRHPWLPGPEVLLWACVRAARATLRAARAAAGPIPRPRTGATPDRLPQSCC